MKFLTEEGNGPEVVYEWLLVKYGDVAYSEYKVKYWCKKFKWGREFI
jgi:hypothetical protein